jgi:putative DNA primase/helicase
MNVASIYQHVCDKLGVISEKEKVFCPAHGGNTLQVSQLDKCVAIRCWAGCEPAKLKQALKLDMPLVESNGCVCVFADGQQQERETPLTLDSLASYVGIRRGALCDWGCFEQSTEEGIWVGIPYHDRQGQQVRLRYRKKLQGKDKYIWQKGAGPILPYGLKRLADAKADIPLWLVEGETDTWTLWERGIPALGLPGSGMTTKLDPGHLRGFSTIYIWQEPDQAGGKFASSLLTRLKEVCPEKVVKVIVQDRWKDPCEMFNGGGKLQEDWLVDPKDYAAAPTATTQKELSRQFVKWCRHLFRHNAKLGGWMAWQENVYQTEADHLVYKKMADYLDHLQNESYPNAKTKKTFDRFIERYSTTAGIKSSIEGAAPYLHIGENELDANPMQLNLRNGWFDLRSHEFHPHDRPEPFTKLAGTHFDAGATCPLWEQCVSDYWSDPEIVRFFRQQCGLVLSGEQAKQMVYFYGLGNNGKTMIIETMAALLGSYAVAVPVESLLQSKFQTIPCDIARMRGARLVTTSELPDGKPLNESLVKHLTGGGTISARYLRENPFEFKACLKLWFDGNYKPTLTTDSAIWDRLIYLPFTRSFAKDQSLAGRLKMELPGILNWCLAGWQDYQLNGLTIPAQLEAEKETFKAESNDYKQFLEIFFERDADSTIDKGAVWDVFVYWWKENHPGGWCPDTKRFKRELMQLGVVDQKKHEGWYWLGLNPKDSFDHAQQRFACPV